MKSKLNERLKEAIDMRNLTPTELARIICEDKKNNSDEYSNALSSMKSTISKVLTGKATGVSADNIFSIAHALNVSEAWLLGYDVEAIRKKRVSEILEEEKICNLCKMVEFPMPTIENMTCSVTNLKCGGGLLVKDYINYDSSAQKFSDVDFAVQAMDDAMIGIHIKKNDYVYVRAQEMVNDGDVAAILLEDGIVRIRRFYKNENDYWILNAENSKVSPIIIDKETQKNSYILGKVIYVKVII